MDEGEIFVSTNRTLDIGCIAFYKATDCIDTGTINIWENGQAKNSIGQLVGNIQIVGTCGVHGSVHWHIADQREEISPAKKTMFLKDAIEVIPG